MNVVVFLSGVHDPKWPLPAFTSSQLPPRAGDKVIFSPFDEAALELALRMKQHRSAHVEVVIAGGEEMMKLARSVAAFKPDKVSCLCVQEASYWLSARMAAEFAAHLKALASPPDIILIGREFGDFDDGIVGPMMARLCGFPFWPLAQDADLSEESLQFIRERAGAEESLTLAGPTVVSVTNDRRNRLRKPLMKNVIGARKAEIGLNLGLIPHAGEGQSRLTGLKAVDASRKQIDCNILSGPIEAQARELGSALASLRKER